MRTSFAFVLLFGFLAVTWVAYSPGFSGSLHYDDLPNLGALSTADSPLKLLDFVVSGQAGPLGRPLSLATFALQSEHWDGALSSLLKTNVALHLVAGCAVFALSAALAATLSITKRQRICLSLFAAVLWVTSPFLASTQLMLVQRMTTLAGLLVFAGLAAFAWGRILASTRPRVGGILMILGLSIGTLLATLAKENGALLPLLALVVDRTVFRNLPSAESWVVRRGVGALLWLPSFALLFFLLSRVPSLATVGGRGYTPFERLISQPEILLDYVLNLLVPASSSITPFTDGRVPVTSPQDLAFILSALLLAGAVALSFKVRRAHPPILFGLLFFLVGHLLESTVVYLELYFPHRNYVPAFGLYFTTAYVLVVLGNHYRHLILPAAICYVLSALWVLSLGTTLWGQPRLAAEIWVMQQPNSSRAAHYLANACAEDGDAGCALKMLRQAAMHADASPLFTAQSLLFCPSSPSETDDVVSDVVAGINSGPRVNGLGDTAVLLAERAAKRSCSTLTTSDVENIARAVLESAAYRGDVGVRSKAYNAMAIIAGADGDQAAKLRYMHLAYVESRHLDLALLCAGSIAANFEFDRAIEYLREVREDAPAHPLKAWIWRERVQQWIAVMNEEKSAYNDLVASGDSLETFRARKIHNLP